uniref:Uncharacterized protein n=1 Tax=Amphora coffeiformis TaxID=265554 RepID=A0A7S3LDM3_9STRA|eukprot:scaffold448_cov156-Amphora_coffeaeformis.AAC.9
MYWRIRITLFSLLVLLSRHTSWSWKPSARIHCGTTPAAASRRKLLGDSVVGTVAFTFALLRPGPSYSIDEVQPECDEACREERLRVIRERRAMMQQSKTTSSRQDLFDLSKQRAALYNTTYQGTSCIPGVPCL